MHTSFVLLQSYTVRIMPNSYTLHYTEIRCELLDDPVNGRIVFYSNSQFLNSVALIACNVGFTLIGADQRQCRESGEWSGQQPVCIGTYLVLSYGL